MMTWAPLMIVDCQPIVDRLDGRKERRCVARRVIGEATLRRDSEPRRIGINSSSSAGLAQERDDPLPIRLAVVSWPAKKFVSNLNKQNKVQNKENVRSPWNMVDKLLGGAAARHIRSRLMSPCTLIVAR